MHLIYPDVAPRTGQTGGRPPNYLEIDASGKWLEHFQNRLRLDHIAKTHADFQTRQRAEFELLTAERKMDYWKKHPNWDFSQIKHEVAEAIQNRGKMPPAAPRRLVVIARPAAQAPVQAKPYWER